MAAKTVVVTGAAGRIGGAIGVRLRQQGYRVVGVDMVPHEPRIDASCDAYVKVDIVAACEAGAAQTALVSAMAGAQAVVHCAAWPGPSATPPPAVVASGAASKPAIGLEPVSPPVLLRDNVAATSAVCDAAVSSGVGRVVFSSSAFAQGYSHAATGQQSLRPKYLPIDEAHGALPHETYGLSKHVGEQVLETAARTALNTSFVSLRFTNIVKRELWHTLPWPAPTAAEPLTLVCWAYTHEDDVIEAHVAAATKSSAAAPGTHEPYIIAAPDTRFTQPTLSLLESVQGLSNVPLRGPMEGNASVLSARKAAARLGFSPRSWQDDAAEAPAESVAKRARRQVAPALTGRGSPAARRALADPHLAHFSLEGFRLEDGTSLPAGATLAYRLYGPAIGQGRGLILHPTSYDAVHDELEYNLGEGRTLDTKEYTVCVANMLGNGVSYSPSLIPDSERAAGPPPLFTVADNVRAQHAMLTSLGARCDSSMKLALVYGYSMGGLQAYEWAVAYPDAVERIAVSCGASRCGELNGVFLGSLEMALKADAAWESTHAGYFGHTPQRGLTAFGSIYAGWGVGSTWYINKAYEKAGYTSASDFVLRSYIPGFASCDADDLLSQIRTWRAADVAHVTGGDLALALRRVKAKVLLMPCDTDRYFTLTEAQAEAAALGERVTLAPIVSPAGHRAGDPHRPELEQEAAFLRERVRELLAS